MSDELKPCPFCGGEANAWEYDDEQDVLDPTSLGWIGTRCITWHCVGCESCEISISRLLKDDAEAAWNARAERTCRIDGVRGGGNCGTTTYRLSCGHAAVMPDGIRFRHCPECGAKVVDMVGVEEAPC